MTDSGATAWVDASAGIAGDMLLAALVDAGADLQRVAELVDAVVPGAVRFDRYDVTRAGLRAAKVDVHVQGADPPYRTWGTVRDLLVAAPLPGSVRQSALAVFGRLAAAEARVHGVAEQDVHFHEVGALDAIADVVGVCVALADLRVDRIVAGPVALGSGRVGSDHGDLPVPVPAVLQLATGWRVTSGGAGERATPTGMALLTGLANAGGDLPDLSVLAVGVGAGSRDTPGAPNVTRVVLGTPARPASGEPGEDLAVLEATVDDLDPRLWPEVLSALLAAGAADAWLAPVTMKKGRPAQLLSVLARPDLTAVLREVMFAQTTTLGVRQAIWQRFALPRTFASVDVPGGRVAIKIAHRDGVIVTATPEFEDVAACARVAGLPVGDVLAIAATAAAHAGMRAGQPVAQVVSGPGTPVPPAFPGRAAR